MAFNQRGHNEGEKALQNTLSAAKRGNTANSVLKDVSLAAGVVAAPLGIGTAIWAINKTRGFDVTKDTVSSLLTGPNGKVLTASLVAGAVLAVTSSYGFYEIIPETKLGKTGIVALGASTVALAVAAIEHPPNPVHEPLAAGYFATAIASLAMIGYGLYKKGKKASGTITMAASAAATAVIGAGVIQDHLKPAADFELAASAIPGAWMTVTAGVLLVRNTINHFRNRNVQSNSG